MTNTAPGHLLLYRDPESRLLWPAIHLTDDILPRTFLATRPCGFFTLILKLSPVVSDANLRWAVSSDLNSYDPVYVFQQRDCSTCPSDLAAACEVADNILETNPSLSYWKSALAGHSTIVISDDDEDDEEVDEQMRQAMELSLLDVRAEEARRFPPALMSSIHQAAAWQDLPRWSSNHTKYTSSGCSEEEIPSPGHTTGPPQRSMISFPERADLYDCSSQSTKRSALLSPLSSEDEQPFPLRRIKRRPSADHGPTQRGIGRRRDSCFEASSFRGLPTTPRIASSQVNAPVSNRQPQRSAQRKNKAAEQSAFTFQTVPPEASNGPAVSAVDDDDNVIEESLEESNQFVQIFVGPEVEPEDDPEVDPERKQHRFQLPKRDVWERSYFRSTVHAVSHITPTGENAWELTHPNLTNISPDDFRFAAEYLTDGDFGHRQPEGEEQVEETFAQCMSAWAVAQELNMDDLQEHIIDKIQATTPWDMYHIMAFAVTVYSSTDFPSEACLRFRVMLSSYIAEHFTIFVRDEALREQFLDRLQQIPALRADVHMKVAEEARAQCQPDDHERKLLEQHDSGTT